MVFKVTAFEWDDFNRSELSNHDIFENEAETVFIGKCYWWKSRVVKGERRYRVTGKTFDGRFLTLVATIKSKENIRVITGWDAEDWEIKKWRSKK